MNERLIIIGLIHIILYGIMVVWGNVWKLISQNQYMELTIPNLVSILPIVKKQLSKGTNSIKNEKKQIKPKKQTVTKQQIN